MASEHVFRQESQDTRIREGESFADYSERLKAGEARTDGLGESSAAAAFSTMLARKASTRSDEDDVPDAAKARRDMIKRKTTGSRTDPPAKPPKSASFANTQAEAARLALAQLEAEGDDDDEEGEEDQTDMAQARKAMMERRMGKRP